MSALSVPYSPGTDDRRQGPFVVLEGVSGVGKSTLARLLADRLGATAIHTLTTPHTDWSDTINRNLRPLPQLAFYLSGLLHTSDAIRQRLGTGPVVADRYASSVMACHAAVNQVGLDQVRELISPFLPYLVVPDATFYLTSSDNSLRERMDTKTDVKQDDTDLFDIPGRLARLRENFQSVAESDLSAYAVMVATDGRGPDGLADIIVKHLESNVLNPVDTDSVIRDGRLAGVFPGEIHEGVAWWAAACFVVVSQAGKMAVAHDSHPTTAEFHRRFCRGAINAEHWGCQVSSLGTADEAQLLHAMKELGGVPGALLTTTDDGGGQQTVTIRLYNTDGRLITEDTGLAKLRKMIASDRVPLPVNDQAKGTVTERHDLVEAL